MKPLLLVFAVVGSLVCFAHAQTTVLWSSAGSSAWLTAANWTGSALPGTGDIARFGSNPTSATTGVGINLNGSTNNGSMNEAVGAIEVTSSRTNNLIFGNSSTTISGTLTLNGTTVNSVSNVILRNNSGGTVTVQDIQGGAGTRTMTIALGNSTNNVISIDGTGGVTISSLISGSSKQLTLSGTGSGTLTLSGANTYTGGTNINATTLKLSGSGTLGSTSASLSVAGGTLDINSTTQTVGAFTLSSGTVSSTSGGGSLTASSYAVQAGTISAKLSGSGALTKSTGGTVTLSGANDYSGGTTVGAGTLAAGHANALGTGSVSIGSSGMLAINNVTIGNTLALTNGSTVSGTGASNGIGGAFSGSAALNGPLSLTSTAVYGWNIGDKLTLNSLAALSVNSAFSLSLSALTTSSFATGSNQTWTVIDGSAGGSSITGSAINITNVSNTFSGLGSFNYLIGPSALTLNWTTSAVPEPSTYAAILGAVALTGAIIRRKRLAKSAV